MFSSFQKIILNRNQLALSGMQCSGSGVWRGVTALRSASQTFRRCFPTPPPASCPGRTPALPLPKSRSVPGQWRLSRSQLSESVLSPRCAQADGLQRTSDAEDQPGPAVSPGQTAALLLRQTPGGEEAKAIFESRLKQLRRTGGKCTLSNPPSPGLFLGLFPF